LKNSISIALFFFISICLVSSCGLITEESPSNVVAAFQQAAKTGSYSEVSNYLSQSSSEYNLMKKEGIQAYAKCRAADKYEILKEEINKGLAKVIITKYSNGSSANYFIELVKEKMGWRIAVYSLLNN